MRSNIQQRLESLPKFTKSERSSFRYWYAHWKAFNLTAVQLERWKVKYLFHDIEKPFLRLVWDYKKVQKWHRKHSRHHIEYPNWRQWDFEAMVIDWECSRYTKLDAPMNAEDTFLWYLNTPEEKEKIANIGYFSLNIGYTLTVFKLAKKLK